MSKQSTTSSVHEIQRDAYFSTDKTRLTLSRMWGDGPTACVIGCNPSDASALIDDPTSRWWNNWFMHHGYGGYLAVNVFPYCSAQPHVCHDRYSAALVEKGADLDAFYRNIEHVAKIAKSASKVYVCWGNSAPEIDPVAVKHIVDAIQGGVAPQPDLWCWGTNKSGSPRHPQARGKNRPQPLEPAVIWRSSPR